MTFILTKRPKKPDEQPQSVAQPRVNIENADPERVYIESESKPTPAADPTARPALTFDSFAKSGKTDPNAPIEANATAPTNTTPAKAMQPLHSDYELDTAELEDRNKPNEQNPYLKKKNSKLKSAFLGALESGGQAARYALQSGARNPLAYALGGALGGGAGGAIHDSWDEERKNAERKAELEHNIGYSLKQGESEADIGRKRAQPLLELTKLKQDQSIHDEQLQLQRELEAGRMTRAEYDLRSKDLDRRSREQEGQRDRASREKIQDVKDRRASEQVPKEYFTDPDKIKNDALAEVLSKPEYHETGIRPEVLAAFKDDPVYMGDKDHEDGTPRPDGPNDTMLTPVERIIKRVRSGDLKAGEVFVDRSKGPMLERDVAATYARLSGVAQERDQFLRMATRGTTPMTLSDFEQAVANYRQKAAAAKNDSERQGLRHRFELELRRVKVQ